MSRTTQRVAQAVRVAVRVAGSLVVAACHPQAVATRVDVDTAAASDSTDPDPTATAWLSVRGEGSTVPQAETAARTALAVRLLDDPLWLSLYPIEIHAPADDPRQVQDHGQGHVSVALGLSRARAAAVVSAFGMSEPQLTGPVGWRETLYTFVTARAAAHLCTRRRALFEADCEPGDTSDSDRALAALAATVSLVPEYPDGVPVDPAGNALHAPAVHVLWNGVPTGEIPVTVILAEPRRVVSDPTGRVEIDVAVGAAVPPSAKVRVDADALLGPFADAWPSPPVAIVARPLSLRRWTLLGGSAVGGAGATDRFVAALRDAGLGAGAANANPKELAALRDVAAQTGARRREALAAFAHRMRGAVDYVLRVDAEAAFASRMGGDRVWYQAQGTLEVVQVWSGESVATVRASVRASGVGDARAEAAARSDLVSALIAALRTDAHVPWPDV